MSKYLTIEIDGFAPSLHRPNPYLIAGEIDSRIESSMQIEPFDAVKEVHDPYHFASFHSHVDQIVSMPIKQAIHGDRKFVELLGMVVVELMHNGSYDTYLWARKGVNEWQAIGYKPLLTTMLEFPRTDLWSENLRELLLQESMQRIGDKELAQMWAGWAWFMIEMNTLSSFDRRRMQSRVRKALNPNWIAVAEVVQRNKASGKHYVSFNDYNSHIIGRNSNLK